MCGEDYYASLNPVLILIMTLEAVLLEEQDFYAATTRPALHMQSAWGQRSLK